MPHISVKLFAGRDDATKLALAKALQAELSRVLHTSTEHISVAVEDVSLEEWGAVYDRKIHDAPHLLIPLSYDWDAEYLRMTGRPRKKERPESRI